MFSALPQAAKRLLVTAILFVASYAKWFGGALQGVAPSYFLAKLTRTWGNMGYDGLVVIVVVVVVVVVVVIVVVVVVVIVVVVVVIVVGRGRRNSRGPVLSAAEGER